MEEGASEEEGEAMCKQSSDSSTGGATATYAVFLDALLTCCADRGGSDFDISGTNDLTVVSGGGGGVGQTSRAGSPSLSTSGVVSATDDSNSVKEPLAESILPHLRFNPLLSSTIRQNNNDIPTSISSIDDFFDLFLADEAPHSFIYFHKSKGDEEIKATPWKMGQKENELERTITFVTSFTPKNLQETQDPNKEVATTTTTFSAKTITDINNPTLTLAVTSHQILCRKPSKMILESLLSFDFVDSSKHKKTSLSKMLNLSLTQFLISNDVKGSEVIVRVVLKEGNGGIDSTVTAAASGEQQVTHPFLLPDRLTSVSENPLSGSLEVGSDKGGYNKTFKHGGCDVIPGCNVISPTHIGASLLSAIRARNCPTPPNLKSQRSSNPVDEAALFISKHSEKTTLSSSLRKSALPTRTVPPSPPPPPLQRHFSDDTYDVLHSASSRGSLKFKHISSFEAGLNPRDMTMRRMLWEKDGRVGDRRRDDALSSEDETPLTSLHAPLTSSPRKGLSMHIEMEVCNTNTNSMILLNSSSSYHSTFSRSRSNGVGLSLAYIEEKVRKGIKKRVARSWITWAESWCMRLWEDERIERFLRKGSPPPLIRRRSNTRPTVRRIGEEKKSPVRVVPEHITPNAEMMKLVQKHTQNVEMKQRQVTPTSSPTNLNGWTKLKVENGNQRYRWMSSEEEDQYGVEVCASPVKKRATLTGGRSSPIKNIIRGFES